MKRVLVTGARGFIGRHALPSLIRRGYDVHAVTSREPAGDARVCWHRADLMTPDACADLMSRVQPTHLLHFAWYTEHGRFWSSPLNLRWVQASLELVQAFQRSGGRRMTLAGTCAEYARSETPCTESGTALAPATLYAAAKHGLQVVTTAFANQTDLSSAWGRIFHLFGPHEAPGRLVPSVVRALLRGEPANCTHGHQVRDFLDVEDVAEAFVALLDSDVTGAVNIGSGVPTSIREVVENIGRQLGRTDLIRLGAIAASPDDPPVLVPDTRRLAQEVGWHPVQSLSQGLARSIDWWRAGLATGVR